MEVSACRSAPEMAAALQTQPSRLLKLKKKVWCSRLRRFLLGERLHLHLACRKSAFSLFATTFSVPQAHFDNGFKLLVVQLRSRQAQCLNFVAVGALAVSSFRTLASHHGHLPQMKRAAELKV